MDIRWEGDIYSSVAQRFILGFSGHAPNPITERFLKLGLGGLIFFRDNFQGLESPVAVAQLLSSLVCLIPEQYPAPFLSIDQEGGQVERLPHTLFPSLVTPRAVALAETQSSIPGFAGKVYQTLASHLALLGFNMNFFPTLDVNFEPKNPIIGVRAFGNDPETVWRFGQIAIQAHLENRIIPVGKHFPGHGNGTVDSHLELPTLNFTEAELQPFQRAIDTGIPAMLVSHGYYPALQQQEIEQHLPASASPLIIQGLLRERCGFQGLIITDDMCMGAITRYRDPVEAALQCLKAGVDILLYKQSTETEWDIFQAVVHALESGQLDMAAHQAAVSRINQIKSKIFPESPGMKLNSTVAQFVPNEEAFTRQFSPHCIQTLANEIARQAITVLSGNPSDLLPLKPERPVLLIHPNRSDILNYAFDQPTSPELPELLATSGLQKVHSISYRLKMPEIPIIPDPPQGETYQCCVFVTFNPLSEAHVTQREIYAELHTRFSSLPIILVSAGAPEDQLVFPDSALHLALCSYRPPSMQALSHVLNGITNSG